MGNGDSKGYWGGNSWGNAESGSGSGSGSGYFKMYNNDKDYSTYYSSAPVTLHGKITINGVNNEALSSNDLEVIRASLAQEFADSCDAAVDKNATPTGLQDTVQIESWSSVPSSALGDSEMQRRGLAETDGRSALHQIEFRVAVVAERFGLDGSRAGTRDRLAGDLAEYLRHSMRAGLFNAKLVSRARKVSGPSALLALSSVQLTRLRSAPGNKSGLRNGVLADSLVALGVLLGVVCGALLSVLAVRRWGVWQAGKGKGSDAVPEYSVRGSSVPMQTQLPGVMKYSSMHQQILNQDEIKRQDHVML